MSSLLRYESSYFFLSCVEAARKVSPDWSQKTMTRHSFNCFSIVWGHGLAPLVTSLLSSCYRTCLQMCFIFKLCVIVTAPEITSKLKFVLASSVFFLFVLLFINIFVLDAATELFVSDSHAIKWSKILGRYLFGSKKDKILGQPLLGSKKDKILQLSEDLTGLAGKTMNRNI